MNTELIRKKEASLKVKTTEKYPNTPVIELLPLEEGKRATLRLNSKAFMTLDIANNENIITFNEYLISEEDQPDIFDLVLFSTNNKVIKAGKQYKSYKVSQGTKRCISNEIYNMISERYNLDTTISNYFELKSTNEKTEGAYTLTHLTKIFDKGEERKVELIQH